VTFQPCPGIAEVVCGQTLRGENVLNIVHYEIDTGVWDPTTLLALVNQIKTNWKSTASGLVGSQSNQLAVARFTARSLAMEADAEVISTVTNGAGASTTGAMESSIAGVVTLGTGISGRSYRGRVYIGGLNTDLTVSGDPNHLTATEAGQLATRAAYTFSNGIGTGVQHVVLSRVFDKIVRDEGIGTTVSSYTANTRLDNQRRRMPRV
jgi:hypothetical protein